MTDEKIDQILRQTLSPIIPDENLNQNLKREMEEKKVKHFNMKKMVILAAACCLLAGTVSVASSGKIVTIISGTGLNTVTSFDKLSKMEEEAGFEIDAVENFSNGYAFSEMSIDNYTGMDENDNTVSQNKGICVIYEKTGNDPLFLETEKSIYNDEDDRAPVQTVHINGVEVNYYVDTYKWVTVEYELTAEDVENLERSDYNISEGADEDSENQVSSAVWVKDGVRYELISLYKATPAEMLFEMAEELIRLP